MTDSSMRDEPPDGPVATTALSRIDGEAGHLEYRGYDVHALAGKGSFAESLYLLWYGELPGRLELAAFEGLLAAERGLPEALFPVLRALPPDSPRTSALRTAASVLGQLDPNADDRSPGADLRKAARLAATFPTAVATIERLAAELDPVDPDPGLSHAANFLYMLSGERPSETEARALDRSLLLFLEHGLEASTLACRVVASTRSDLHSAIVAGVSALGGPRHGGPSEPAMGMLLEIGEPERVEGWIDAALAQNRRVPGFGHRVYGTEDPRATHLRRLSAELAGTGAGDRWHELARRTEETMRDRTGIPCDAGFWGATVLHALGLPLRLFRPVFAIARVGGWAAHAMEQYRDDRPIRPRAAFTGTLDRPYVPIDRR